MPNIRDDYEVIYAARSRGKKYLIQDTVIIDQIYKEKVDTVMANKVSAVKSCIERFVHKRQAELYDYAPIDRIFFRKQDSDDFFKSSTIVEKEITAILPELYYYKDDELQACKDEFSLSMLMTLRWMIKNKKAEKDIELFAMYLAFSGKFYASCHAKWFTFTPKREVMDYVVNYMLSQKFDLIKEKSVWGAIKNLVNTWLDTYSSELVDNITDERIVYLIHQLYHRIYAFLRNIAKLYYEAYDKKLYLNKESDNYDQDNFRIANNNSTVAATITEKTINYMTTTQVNASTCQAVSGSGVDYREIKAIFENILNTNEHLDELRFVINVMITDFMNHYPEAKELTGPEFIAHSIAMKPNTKDENILKEKAIILNWLNMSERYKSIKTQATKNNYFKAILSYIAITVNTANKE